MIKYYFMFEEIEMMRLVQLLKVGTRIEAGHAYRGDARFSRYLCLWAKVSGILTRSYIHDIIGIYACYYDCNIHLSYCIESRDISIARYYCHIETCAWGWDDTLRV